jgi:hypothetical protein
MSDEHIYNEESMLRRLMYNRPSNEWFLNNLNDNPIILDIGACDGLDSINLVDYFLMVRYLPLNLLLR